MQLGYGSDATWLWNSLCIELPRGVIGQSDLVRGVPLLIGDEIDGDVLEGAERVSSEESSSFGC